MVRRRWCDDTGYAIGTQPTGLMTLRNMGIAVPDQVIFQPAASYYARGDLSRVGDGFATVRWIWDVISLHRLANVLGLLDGEDFADVYIYTDRRDGRSYTPSQAFNVYSAVMWWPLLFGQEGSPIARSPYALQTVMIQFKNVIFYAGYLV